MTTPSSNGTNGYEPMTNGRTFRDFGRGRKRRERYARHERYARYGSISDKPTASGDAATGLFSAATGAVSIASAGTDVADFTASGVKIGQPGMVVPVYPSISSSSFFMGAGAGNGTTTGIGNTAIGSQAAGPR